MNLKVLMFVSNPFTNDPRVYNEARSLIGAGHQVTVVASDWEKTNPLVENWDGIRIVRVRICLPPRYATGSPVWRALSLLLWQWQAYRRALALKRDDGFDLVHCHDLDTLAIGVRLKRIFRLPLIYDVHEIYGHMAARAIPQRLAKFFLWLERRLVRNVDQVITVHEALKRHLVDITDKPISIVMNCKPLLSREYQPAGNSDGLIVLYVGILHKGRALSMLIDAASELSGVRCIIGGIGNPGYVRELKEKCDGVPNVEFIGRVPFDEVIPMTRKADVVFLMISPDDPNNRMGLGNKQFEAMVCGRPIICTRGTYSGELTEQEDVGLTIEYDREALKQAIVRLRDDPELRDRLGRNALRAAATKYNWESQEAKLLEVYGSFKPPSG
jgi:glycosyltransferase involved in cell wall biosynthesis